MRYYWLCSFTFLMGHLQADYVVDNTSTSPGVTGSLPWAIDQANITPGTITFDSSLDNQTITITAPYAPLLITNTYTIDGETHNITISGGNAVQPFAVTSSFAPTISNLTISQGNAVGGAGGSISSTGGGGAGGGGAGLGGAVFADSNIIFLNVCFTNNNAIGGAGGSGTAGSGIPGGGGGGGLGGAGGSQASNNAGGAGGGGQLASDPGNTASGSTGGAGGLSAIGGPCGGKGGNQDQAGTSGQRYGGGGGAGSTNTGSSYKGGDGGYGGGGGGEGDSSATTAGSGGGIGGLGGGGGGVSADSAASAAGSLFGGGSGGYNDTNGRGGCGGGGGAGLGGAVFISDQSTTTLGYTTQIAATNAFSGNGVQGGAAGSDDIYESTATAGSALGPDLFIDENGTLIFDLAAGVTLKPLNPIASNTTGTCTIEKRSAGTLDLSGADHTFAATIDLILGTISIASDSNLGNVASTLHFDSGTLETTQSFTSNRAITISSSNGTIQTDSGTTWTQTGSISGVGSLIKTGDGALALSGTNSYQGSTTIQAGTIRAAANNAFSSVSAVVLANTSGVFLDLNGYSNTIASIAGGGSGGGNVLLGSGTLTVGDSSSTIFSGTITGSGGGLIKQGSGTLQLNTSTEGGNTYSGSTQITQGTLQAGGPNVFSSFSDVVLADSSGVVLDLNNQSNIIGSLSGGGSNGGNVNLGSGTLTVGNSVSTVFDGVISGTGGKLIKQGSGSLSLTNVQTYTGLTQVSGGTLILNGSIVAGIEVDEGAILKGTGTIGGNALVSGTLIPGNSIGTINFSGSLTLDNNSFTQIEISPSNCSLIDVTGSASLDGTLVVVADSGSYQNTQPYTILTATGGVSGKFNSTPTIPNGFYGSIAYNSNSVVLTIEKLILPIPSQGGNSANIATYLNQNAKTPSLQSVLRSLFVLTPSQLSSALQSISPARNASVTYSSQNTMLTFTDSISSRMANQRIYHSKFFHFGSLTSEAFEPSLPFEKGLALVALKQEDKSSALSPARGSAQTLAQKKDVYAIWVDGFTEFTHQDSQNQTPAFHLLSGGTLLGFDYYGLENAELGTCFGYARNSIHEDQNQGNSTINFYSLGLYGTGYLGSAYLEGAIWGTYNQFCSRRHISFPGFDATASASYHGYQLTPHVAAGYDFMFSWGVVEPYIACDAPINFQQGYQERGAGSLNMSIQSSTSSMLRSEVGLHTYEAWQGDWGVCILKETLSYLNKNPFSIGKMNAAIVGAVGSFTVDSFTSNQSLFSPALEVFFRRPNGFFFSLLYEGEFGSGYTSNEALGRIGAYF